MSFLSLLYVRLCVEQIFPLSFAVFARSVLVLHGCDQRACEKCGRAGQYSKVKLIERFGADVRLPDLREEIARCEPARHIHDMCGVHYVGLT